MGNVRKKKECLGVRGLRMKALKGGDREVYPTFREVLIAFEGNSVRGEASAGTEE